MLAVVVVTHNSAGAVEPLLESLAPAISRSVAWRLLVVDNASTDTTLSLVEAVAPAAEVIDMGRNAGYAAAINAAITAAPDLEHLLVVNPDTRLAAGSIDALLDAQIATKAGIVAPRLVDAGGETLWSLRREPTIARAWGDAVLGGRRAGRRPRWGEMVMVPADYTHAHEVDWASGAALLVSRSCLDAVGPWDESFFLYSEETDFALRARDAGFATYYEPSAVVTHLEGESHTSPKLWALLTVNRQRLFRRRNGRLAGAAFWVANLVGEVLRSPRSATHRAAIVGLLTPRRTVARVAAADAAGSSS